VSGRAAGPSIIVLASGRGERFVASGGQGSKLQALLGGKPVLERTLAAVRESGLPWHLEDAGHAGMGDSIAAGVRATQDAGGWLILHWWPAMARCCRCTRASKAIPSASGPSAATRCWR
jgi:CTP:molybdopterin cytidylyltransferase MocA